MVVKDLYFKLWQEVDGLLSDLNTLQGKVFLRRVELLGLLPTVFDKVEDLRKHQVHMREKTGLVLGIDLKEKLHDGHRLNVDDLMDHFKDGVSELDHCLGNELDDLLHYDEERLIQSIFVLLEHSHQHWDQHRHERHGVRLILDDIADRVQADLVMIA